MSKIIKAQKRSEDPVQQALRQHKREWNTEARTFMARLKGFKPHFFAFKRSLNGSGDPKSGLPSSDIKHPIPGEVVNYLGGVYSEFNELASIFDKLVGDANSIIQEQSQYSVRRRKSQPKEHNPMFPRRNAIEEQAEEFIVEASNPLTRAWAHLSSWFSSDELKDKRLSMLTTTHQLFKDIVEIEDNVLARGIHNIPDIYTLSLRLNNDIDILHRQMVDFAPQLFSNKPEEKSKEKPKEKPKDKQKKKPEPELELDLDSPPEPVIPLEPPPGSPPPIKSAPPPKKEFEPDPQYTLTKLHNQIVQALQDGLLIQAEANKFFVHFRAYTHPINKLNADQQSTIIDVMKHVFEELKEIAKARLKEKKKSEENNVDDFSKMAAPNFLKSIMMSSKDPTYLPRKEIYQVSRELKRKFNELMDLLENKHVNLELLYEKMKDIKLDKLNKQVELLESIYENKYYTLSKDHSRKDPNIDPVGRHFSRRVRRHTDSR